MYVSRACRQPELAAEFAENHVLALPGLRAIDQAEPIGAPASKAYLAELLADPQLGEQDRRHHGLGARRPAHAQHPRDEPLLGGDEVGADQHDRGPADAAARPWTLPHAASWST